MTFLRTTANFDFGTAHTGATYNHYHGTERFD
jgi:hypothetical protein